MKIYHPTLNSASLVWPVVDRERVDRAFIRTSMNGTHLYALQQGDSLHFSALETSRWALKELLKPYQDHDEDTLHVIIKRAIRDSVQSIHLLGMGHEASVYKIPLLQDYAIRVVRDPLHKKIPGDYRSNKQDNRLQDVIPKMIEGYLQHPEVSFVRNALPVSPEEIAIGQPMYQLATGIYLVKRLTGEPASINWNKVPRDKQNAIHFNDQAFWAEASNRYKAYINQLAKVDQAAYDDFARLVKAMYEKGHILDPSASNLYVDFNAKDSKGIFQPFDFTTREKMSEYGVGGRGLVDMLGMLLDISYLCDSKEHKLGDAHEDNRMCMLRGQIVKKCIIGAKKAGLQAIYRGRKNAFPRHTLANIVAFTKLDTAPG